MRFIIIYFIFCLCVCVNSFAFDAIKVDPVTGRPAPTGTAVNKLSVFRTKVYNRLHPDIFSFIKWEIHKAAAKKLRKLGSLSYSSSPNNGLIPCYLNSSFDYVFFEEIKDIVADYVVISVKNNMGQYQLINTLNNMGKQGRRFATIISGRSNSKDKIDSSKRYSQLLLNFSTGKNVQLDALCVEAGSPIQAVRDVTARNLVNKDSYWYFLRLMEHAGYPREGEDTLLKFYSSFIKKASEPNVRDSYTRSVIVAAAHLPRLAEKVKSEFNPGDDKVFFKWLRNRKYDICVSWCVINGIKDPAYFDKVRKNTGSIQYAIVWAEITGDGDRAFEYIMKQKSDRIYPSVMVDLLGVDCRLSQVNREKILRDVFTKKKYFTPVIDYQNKRCFAIESYPVIDRVLNDTLGDAQAVISELYLHPNNYTLDPKRFSSSGRYIHKDAQSMAFYRWGGLIKRFDFIGYLYARRSREFFYALWKYRNSSRGHDFLMGGGPIIIPYLLEMISDNKPYTSIEACDFISNMGTYAAGVAAEPLLKKLKTSNNRYVKGAIIRALGEIKAQKALPYLKELSLHDKDELIRVNASQTIMLFQKITLKDAENVIKEKYNLHRRN